MTKKEQLLNKIKEQEQNYLNDKLILAKANFKQSILTKFEQIELSDIDIDILLKEDNLLGELLDRSINKSLEFQEYSCGWQDIEGFINDKKNQKQSSNEEM